MGEQSERFEGEPRHRSQAAAVWSWVHGGAAAVRGTWRLLFTGFSREDVGAGVKLMLAWAVLLGIYAPPAVWNQLSSYGASPTLILVLCGCYIQPLMGATFAIPALAMVTGALASGAGFAVTYIAYAANGGSYEGYSAAKGASLVAAASVVFALFVIPRMRLATAALAFQTAGFLLAARIYTTYWFEEPGFGPVAVPFPPNKGGYYIFLDLIIPAGVAVPVVWLVMPAPATRKARVVFSKALQGLGQLSSAVVDLALDGSEEAASVLAETGSQTALNGQEPPSKAGSREQHQAMTAGALSEELEEQQRTQDSVQKGLQGMGMLLLAATLEYDLYATPHRLRTKAFKRATSAAAAADTCLGVTLSWLARRRRPLDTSMCLQLAPQLRAVQAALMGCFQELAAVVEDRQTLSAALEQLAELESSRRALNAAVDAAGGSPEGGVVLAVLRSLLYLCGTQVRLMFQSVAEAMEPLQPGSQAAAAAHFASSDWLQAPIAAPAAGDRSRQQVLDTVAAASEAVAGGKEGGGLADGEAEAAKADSSDATASAAGSEAGQPVANGTEAGLPADSPTAAASKCGSSLPASTCTQHLPAVVRPSAPLEARPRSAVRRLCDRAGLGPPQLLPVLHMLVSAAAAGTLVVVRSAFVGLGGHSDWVTFTVNSVFEKSSGRIRSRGLNRVLGTLWGVAWSLATIGLCSAAAGGGYANNAGKYVMMVVMVTLWAGFVGLHRNRHPRYSYAWTVCMIAVPVVVLEDFKETQPPWKPAGYRTACICIGVGIDSLVTSLLFPVTTNALMLQQLQRALGGVATLAESVAAQQAGASADPPAPAGDAAAAAEAGQLLGGSGSTAGGEVAEEQLRRLQAQALKAKTQVLRFVALSADAIGGPLYASPRARRRHEAVLAVRSHLLLLVDSLLVVTYASEARLAQLGSGARTRGLEEGQRQLVLAVGQQIAESLRCLRHVLDGRMAMRDALRTLPALNALLHRLAAAAGQQLRGQPRQQEWDPAKGDGGEGGGGGGQPVASLSQEGASLMPFTSAALAAGPALRELFHTLAVALLPDDAAAVQAAAEEMAASAAGWPALARAQMASLAASPAV